MNIGAHFRPEAVRDVDRHAEYYRRNVSLEIAIRFYDAIVASVALLQSQPELGERCSFVRLRDVEIRIWRVQGFGEYLIYYIYDGKSVQVLRVLHGKQDIDASLRN